MKFKNGEILKGSQEEGGKANVNTHLQCCYILLLLPELCHSLNRCLSQCLYLFSSNFSEMNFVSSLQVAELTFLSYCLRPLFGLILIRSLPLLYKLNGIISSFVG